MDFQKYLATTGKLVNLETEKALSLWLIESLKVSDELSELLKQFTKANQGGKRLRATLVKLGFELGGGESTNKQILLPAAAIEIFQTSILAHDDVIDLSPLRRGKPTIYKALGGDHYGISQTICLGDIGFFIATKLISESKFEDKNKNRALIHFSDMVIKTGIGEMLDIELPRLKKQRQDLAVLKIHELKTAYYTFIYPLNLGVILAGGSEKLTQEIEVFGRSLGLAFQIQDDILGVFGDEETLGKSVTSDIKEGKNTLLITQALKNADSQHKKIIKKYYGNPQVDQQGVEAIKNVFIESGALDYSKQKAVEYVVQAKQVIPKITKDKRLQNLLNEMADFLINRDK